MHTSVVTIELLLHRGDTPVSWTCGESDAASEMISGMSVQDPGVAGEQAPKAGQQPKGPRRAITTRVPEPDWHVFQAAADEAGLPLGDYVLSVLAEKHSLPEPDYLTRHRKKMAERRGNPNQLDVLDAISA